MIDCNNNCSSGAGTSADNGSPGCPYTFGGDIFHIDTSALNMPMQDAATGDPTLGAIYLQPGSDIFLFGFEIPGPPPTGVAVVAPIAKIVSTVINPTTGNLSSLVVSIPPLPAQGNVYPGSKVIDCVTPDTTGLVAGSFVAGGGFPAGTTLTLTDRQSVKASVAPSATAPSFAALVFSLPVAIPSAGTLQFSPCYLSARTATVLRSCGGEVPQFSDNGLFLSAETAWVDVSERFASATFSWSLLKSVEIDSSVNSSFLSGGGTSSRSDTVNSVVEMTASGTTTVTAASPTKPLYVPVVPASGRFRVYKCKTCCESCFYLFLFNADPTGMAVPFPASLGPIDKEVGTVAGNYTRVIETTTIDSSGDETDEDITESSSITGTINVAAFSQIYDFGLICYPNGQGGSPEQGYGVMGGGVGETSRSISSTGSTTTTIRTGVTSTTTTTPTSPTASVPTFQGSAGMRFDTCTPIGSNSVTSTTRTVTTITYLATSTVTTVEVTINDETPITTTTTVAGSPGQNGTSVTTEIDVCTVSMDIG